MRAVLDANIWVSAAMHPQSGPGRIVRLALESVFVSVISELLIAQVVGALHRLDFAPLTVVETERRMRSGSLIVAPDVTLAVITAKESDNRVLEAAVAGNADVIVTGDRRHLLPLGSYAGIPIVTPAAFLATYAADLP